VSGPVGGFNGMHEKHAWSVRFRGRASSRIYPRPFFGVSRTLLCPVRN